MCIVNRKVASYPLPVLMNVFEKILGYEDLKRIQVRDIGEPLVAIQDEVKKIFCKYLKFDMLPYMGDRMLVRKGVAERLREAAQQLLESDEQMQFHLAYAFRHPKIQKMYFTRQKQILARQEPNLSEAELIQRTHLLVASPDVAGHPTGSAVDITILKNGQPLDMGTEIADFSDTDRIKTFANDLTYVQEANRALLRKTLMASGFSPFDGEWWHFSYGDREWVAYYDKPYAIYDKITAV